MVYKEGARLGDSHCLSELGSMHHRGLTGSKRNKEKAARYFRRGAEKGHARSQFQLGLCYHDCEGVVQSFEQARYWWEKGKCSSKRQQGCDS